MDRGLVLVSGTVRGAELLGAAADLAERDGAELVLFHLGDPDADDARQAVDRVASREVAGRDVAYSVVVEAPTGDATAQLVAAAETRDCDHLFFPARPASGLRSLLGRDPLGRAVRAFDGLVTVGSEPDSAGGSGSGVASPENLAEFEAASSTVGSDSGM